MDLHLLAGAPDERRRGPQELSVVLSTQIGQELRVEVILGYVDPVTLPDPPETMDIAGRCYRLDWRRDPVSIYVPVGP